MPSWARGKVYAYVDDPEQVIYFREHDTLIRARAWAEKNKDTTLVSSINDEIRRLGQMMERDGNVRGFTYRPPFPKGRG